MSLLWVPYTNPDIVALGNHIMEGSFVSVATTNGLHVATVNNPEAGTTGSIVRVFDLSLFGPPVQRGESISTYELAKTVSLSSDGTIVAIGTPYGFGAYVYQWNGSSWNPLGGPIDALESYDDGLHVSLSANGSILAVSAPLDGKASIYKRNGDSWDVHGDDINLYGSVISSISLSDDGSVVAIGSKESNKVFVYKYDAVNVSWVSFGIPNEIDGEAAYDFFGSSVSLSSDGTVLAVGAPYNDGGGNDSGHVRVYNFITNQGPAHWVQRGEDINGEAAENWFGTSVSLSNNGNYVAVGAPTNTGVNGAYSGHVRVFQWLAGAWSQLGSDIDGEAGGDHSGFSVSLAPDGQTVAIGAPYNNEYMGHVRVYKYSYVTKPDPPTGVIADLSNGEASVMWTHPTNTGGAPIIKYTITASPGGATKDVSANVTSTIITGLTYGTSYTFTVRSSNILNVSDPSSPSGSVTPRTIPGAPTLISADPSNGRVTVSWTDSSNNGGSAITGYTVTYIAPGNVTVNVPAGSSPATISGLINGTAYTFSVRTNNIAGSSMPSGSASATPRTIPNPPTLISADPSNGQVTVSWSDSSNNGGSAVTSYTVTHTSTNGTVDVSAGSSPAIIRDLSNGIAYTFRVKTNNIAGSSLVSNSIAATPRTVPGAPTDVSGIPAIRQVTVNWNAPSDTGGSNITGYTVTNVTTNVTYDLSHNVTSRTFADLSNDIIYTFTVVAKNIVGTGSAASILATPLTVPGAPTDVSATAGNAQTTVSWIAPNNNGGSAILGYTVTHTSTNGTVDVSAGSSPAIITGLVNGTDYTFRVRAKNAIGSSVPSGSASAIPRTIPNPPTLISADPSNSQVTVSWSDSSNNGGSAILGYTVTHTSDNGTVDVSAGSSPAIITDLSNGINYTFTVKAKNVAGSSLASNGIVATPRTVPDAPTGVSAIAVDTAVTVSWTAPAINGGSDITGYTVTSVPSSTVVETSGTSTTIAGLVKGTSYIFYVVANNIAGSSISKESLPVIPRTKPGVPTITSTEPSNGRVTVRWSAPTDTGGAAILSYTVRASSGPTVSVDGSQNVVDVSGLTNGVPYTFTVAAVNIVGSSDISPASAPVTPRTVPGAPTVTSTDPNDGQVTVRWNPPTDIGGSAIIDYTVTAIPGNMSETTTGTTAIITGLTNGVPYTFEVVARNAVGLGAVSNVLPSVTPRTLPGAPTDVSGTPGNGQVTVNWLAPTDNGGDLISEYTITASPGGAKATSSGTSATVTGLTNGSAYTFTVVAKNAAGTGSESAASASVTPRTLPGAPTDVSGTPGNAQVTVSWSAPTDNGGVPISEYTVTASPGGATATSSGTSATVTGLTNGSAYTFTVVAKNAAGTGSESAASTSATPRTIPDAPTGITADICNGQVRVQWTASAFNGGADISGYTVNLLPEDIAIATNITGVSTFILDLIKGETYSFDVYATNVAGDSSRGRSNEIYYLTVPKQPIDISANTSNGQVTVEWTSPYDTGGTPITGYTVTSTPSSSATVNISGTTATITGLTKGTSYTFQIVAQNSVGSSLPSGASAAVVPRTVPGAPTVTATDPSNGQVTVNWTAPADNGGADISDYIVTASPGNATITTSGTSATVTGLTNGTAYTFTVVAKNSVGSGAESNVLAAVKPRTVPGKPVVMTAVSSNGQVTVNWTAPSDTGGADISGYIVTASPGDATATSTGTSATVTGLTNGTEYTFKVVAKNIAGSSVDSDSVTATPRTVPGAPTVTTTVPSNGQVTVNWTAPTDNGGADISGYTVTVSPGGATVTTTDISATITGLTNGTEYTFKVVAKNAAGSGADSNVLAAVTPRTVPGKPTVTMVVPSNSQITVNWTAPADNGGADISGYTVTASPGDATITTSGTSATITGLTNGTAYTFTVVARNIAGAGAASDASTPVAPRTVPVAPTVTATDPSNGQVKVSWSAPTDNGGDAIIDYTVTASPGGATVTTTDNSATITGLTNGTEYTFKVVARNATGTGAESAASSKVKPRTVPGAPTVTTTVPSNGQVTVNWTAPADNGGDAVSEYIVTASPGGATATVPGTSATITGLTNGTAYTFKVVAKNAAGSGADSNILTAVTPRTVPGAPTVSTTVPSNGQVTVNWTAPSDTGGNAVSEYIVTATPGGATVTTSGTTATITGLTNGTAYTFKVVAKNAAGPGADSNVLAAVKPRTVPGAPTVMTMDPGNGQVTVSWTAPTDNGGADISGYTVTASPGGATATVSGTSATITGLTNGLLYTFKIVASNAAGVGAESAESSGVKPRTVPGAPTVTSSVPGNGQVTVSWTAPTDTGGADISGYTVTASPGSATATVSGTSATITGLTNGTAYTFSVAARNAAGSGATSNVLAAVKPRTVPGAPTVIATDPSNGQVTVSWTAPTNNGGDAVSEYLVTASPGGATATSSGTSATVTGLTNGLLYTFTVVAKNAAGSGAVSNSLTAVKPRTVPGVPTSVSATLSNGQVAVSWTAPASNGGEAISGYTVTTSPGGATVDTPGTSTTITGLTIGTSYTFTVVAKNAVGTGSASAASNAVVPYTIPGAVASMRARLDNSGNIHWTVAPPTNNGSSAILQYNLVVSRPGMSNITSTATTTSGMLTGLDAGQTYTVTIAAVNIAGTGPTYDTSVSIPAVTNTVTTLLTTGLTPLVAGTLTRDEFKTIVNNTRTTVVPYVAVFPDTNAVPLYIEADARLTVSNKNVKMLIVENGEKITVNTAALTPTDVLHFPGDAGDAYTVDISGVSYAIAFDSTGHMKVNGGAALTLGSRVTLDRTYVVVGRGSAGLMAVPNPPFNVLAVAGNTLATVSWIAPATGGSTITSYRVTSSPGGIIKDVSGTVTTTDISGLTNNTTYTFTVTATNSVGTSEQSAVSLPVTPSSAFVPCFFGNARVLTPGGYRRMDSLREGDRVKTPEGSVATIERVKMSVCPAGTNTNPYVIPVGTFGAEHRVLISPDHKVCLPDGRRVEARRLGLEQEERSGTLTYYNLEVEGQADMVVGGVAVESMAPVKRVVVSLATFEAAIRGRYGAASAAVLDRIKRTCRLVGNDSIEVPVLHQ